jgi:arylsulfatase B
MDSDEPAYDADNPLLRNSQPVNETQNLTDAFTREAIDFIGRHEHQPFFLYLAYNAVHSPMQASQEYLRRFTSTDDLHRRIFAAMLSQLDDDIGRLLDELRRRHLEEQTFVAFLSDNGGPTKELTSSNRPLRGGKGELYEGGIRTPMIIRWPGRLPAGRDEPRLASSLDLVATALATAGAEPKAALDGVNFLPHLTTALDQPIRNEHFWRVGAMAAVRQGQWKLIRPRAKAPWQLFDLSADISEKNNRAASMPEKVRELSALWERWNSEQIAPLWR